MTKFFYLPALFLSVVLGLHAPAGSGATDPSKPTDAEMRIEDGVHISNATKLGVSARPLSSDAVEVTAVVNNYIGTAIASVKLVIWDGGEHSFALPDQPSKLYNFKRVSGRVTVEVNEDSFLEVAQIN